MFLQILCLINEDFDGCNNKILHNFIIIYSSSLLLYTQQPKDASNQERNRTFINIILVKL